jgi:hypothetical protein
VFLGLDQQLAGLIGLLGPGPNGKQIVHLSSTIGDPNGGAIAVTDAANAALGKFRAAMLIDPHNQNKGTIIAEAKSFLEPNPNQAGTEIVYTCIEGPEAAAYVRGTAQLVGGKAIVPFPEHFVAVIAAAGLTVQVMPLSANSLGLAVVSKRSDGFSVKELNAGTGNYEFDWEAKCVRKGQENYRVVRPSEEFALPPIDVGPPVA